MVSEKTVRVFLLAGSLVLSVFFLFGPWSSLEAVFKDPNSASPAPTLSKRIEVAVIMLAGLIIPWMAIIKADLEKRRFYLKFRNYFPYFIFVMLFIAYPAQSTVLFGNALTIIGLFASFFTLMIGVPLIVFELRNQKFG